MGGTAAYRLLLVSALLLAVGGCQELDARRRVQDGNAHFKASRYEKAAEDFEAALAKLPHLEIAHHNLGLTYFKLFNPGLDTPQNKTYAEKATKHFAIYLESHPKENVIRDMMTKIWMDAGDFDRALAHWKALHDAEPRNTDIISRLAGINFKAGRWEASMGWYLTGAEAADSPEARVGSLLAVGNVAWSKLSSDLTVGAERVKVADMGIAALQAAGALMPQKTGIHGLIAALFSFRARAHGPSWAAAIDRASEQTERQLERVLVDAAKKNRPPPAEAPPAGASGAAAAAPI
jgi:tetratricopeptide (TPR) repeat protein